MSGFKMLPADSFPSLPLTSPIQFSIEWIGKVAKLQSRCLGTKESNSYFYICLYIFVLPPSLNLLETDHFNVSEDPLLLEHYSSGILTDAEICHLYFSIVSLI